MVVENGPGEGQGGGGKSEVKKSSTSKPGAAQERGWPRGEEEVPCGVFWHTNLSTPGFFVFIFLGFHLFI